MSEPNSNALDPTTPALAEALKQIEIAGGSLLFPDWEQHAAAIPAMVEALSRFYLHTEAPTGVFDPGPIYLDRSRKVWGLYPAALEPLLDLLARQTERLEVAVAEGQLGLASATTLARWKQRLAIYRVALDQAVATTGRDAPSDALWTNVTAPLMQGIYPPSFGAAGIINPLAPSKPDVTTVPTEIFVVALGDELVDDVQLWLVDWAESVDAWKDSTIAAVKAALAAIAKPLGDGFRWGLWLLGGAVVVGGGFLLVRALSKEKS